MRSDAEVILVEGTHEMARVVWVDFLEDGTQLIFYREFRVDTATDTPSFVEHYMAAGLVEDTLPLAKGGSRLMETAL